MGKLKKPTVGIELPSHALHFTSWEKTNIALLVGMRGQFSSFTLVTKLIVLLINLFSNLNHAKTVQVSNWKKNAMK